MPVESGSDDVHRGILRNIERAATILDRGPETSWTAPSRFGFAGLAARRTLLRILRPYAIRQREFDRAILEVVRQNALAAALDFATPLPDDVIDLKTDIGRLWFDANDELITPLVTKHHLWESDVVAFVRSRLQPGMTFVDVGAHVGYFSVLGSSIVGAAGRVVAVEPQLRNLRLLRANLWRHGCNNVSVVPVAAYERRGYVRFVNNEEGLSGSWIDPEHQAATLVPCASLDELLDCGQVDLIKIDIERAEHAAIRGAESMIANAPVLDIVVEFWPTHPHLGGRAPADVLAYYESLGLELSLLKPDGTTESATATQLLAEGESAPIMNIVLRKR